jgi:tetratricopeptide (TPR) repeat protein
MKAHLTRQGLTGILTAVLPAILTVAAIAVPASAGESKTLALDVAGATLQRADRMRACGGFPCLVLEITGGTAPHVWTLSYPTIYSGDDTKASLLQAPEERAWFSHGSWLRLLDTRRGVVLGRWRFPGQIVSLTPQGQQVRVEVQTAYLGRPDAPGNRTQILAFDPAAPRIPEWPDDSLVQYRVPRVESLLPDLDLFSSRAIPAEKAKALLPEAEDRVRRDPFSPWFRIVLGRLLEAMGDSRKLAVWEEAIRLPGLDYTELFALSAQLDSWGQSELAHEAFERGYRDYLDRGYDPRLNSVNISRLIIYPIGFGTFWKDLNYTQREECLLRIYRFAPAGEAAGIAWESRARELERDGHSEEAGVWRNRLEDARKAASLLFDKGWTMDADHSLLVAGAALLSLVLFVLHRYFHYLPQRRLDFAQGSNRRRLFSTERYWSRGERVSCLIMTLVALLATIVFEGIWSGAFNLARMPISVGMGSLAGAETHVYLESLPPTADRDLYLAMNWQQSGEQAQAEQLYRRLPNFAESWNNLGVLLKQQGKDAEAKRAFEKALELDPQLNEAALNLGRQPADLWTSQYASYFPGRPMLAVPRTGRSRRAIFGGSLLQASIRTAAHPLELLHLASSTGEGEIAVAIACEALMVCVLIFTLLLVSVIPYKDVTLPPSKREWIWATLFPGLGSEWGSLAWLVLPAWSYLLIQLFLFWRVGTPYAITNFIGLWNVVGSYGLSTEPVLHHLGGLNPGWIAMYAAPAALFAANALLVFRSRRNRG